MPRIPRGKNGSINLELVKSLFFFFISENEKDFGEGGRERRGRERGQERGRESEERWGQYTPAKQQQEF